jgi:hypothetical protein
LFFDKSPWLLAIRYVATNQPAATVLRDVRRRDRRVGRDALQAVGNPKDDVKLLTAACWAGTERPSI